ncbi:FUSC family protein [uncultured Clostridium sp.]|uniref:FUSC family protein n=1 Tax=uncultured Clostridium sp. TaxID=59620 RepID=UPI0026737E63|nr:FUSC family protein [uncultured Clostridium sp.]
MRVHFSKGIALIAISFFINFLKLHKLTLKIRLIKGEFKMDKANLKKNIISKTILFVAIMIFVVIFKSIFGAENTPVGITTVITLLMLLGKDLTQSPIKNFLILVGINLALGIGAFIAANNVWVGIIIDFSALSLIGYYFSYNMTKGLILPYGLQYLFMLNGPVYGDVFVKRIGALIAGAVIIMISQFIVNAKKNNTFKKENSIIGFNKDESDGVYREYELFGTKFKVHTIRASYAIRVGFLTALTSFISLYFKLQEGRWMVYTIFSLTELYSENCKVRAWKRLQGTIIGSIILIIFFIFVKSPALRGLMILVVGYLNSFAEDYRDIVVLVTISAVAPLALTTGSFYAVLERIMYVIIGIVLALIANTFILKKSKKDAATTE